MNLSEAIAALFELIRQANRALDENSIGKEGAEILMDGLGKFDMVLGVIDVDAEEDAIPDDVLTLVDQRQEARKNKDYERADAIRDELKALGWEVKDSPEGLKINRL